MTVWIFFGVEEDGAGNGAGTGGDRKLGLEVSPAPPIEEHRTGVNDLKDGITLANFVTENSGGSSGGSPSASLCSISRRACSAAALVSGAFYDRALPPPASACDGGLGASARFD